MAETNVSHARAEIARQCAWEIQAWATMLAQRVDRDAAGIGAPDLWLRGAAIRLDALACAVMTACDSDEPLVDAENHLRGPQHLRAGGAA